MSGSLYTYLASPGDFAGADDIITNLAKEREPGIERTYSLIWYNFVILVKDVRSRMTKIIFEEVLSDKLHVITNE